MNKLRIANISWPGFTLVLILLCSASVWLLLSHGHGSPQTTANTNKLVYAAAPAPVVNPQPMMKAEAVTVAHRENLSTIFKKLHLSLGDLSLIMALGRSTRPLSHLKTGSKLDFLLAPDGRLQQLTYSLSNNKVLLISRTKQGFSAQEHRLNTLAQQIHQSVAQSNTAGATSFTAANSPSIIGPVEYGSATVNRSLYAAGLSAGLSRQQVTELVHLFSLNPEVAKHIEKGNELKILYRPATAENKYHGSILFAELKQANHSYQLFRFKDPKKGTTAYYTANGMSLTPPIIRAPLNYARISSYFSRRRWQPLLHFFRPHYGVDYAAAYGTPVKAAGDGKIDFMGIERGYGNTILLANAAPYKTLYAHLSRFAAKLHNGSYVHQGQIIGYVGDTGLSTGSHLHFEIHVNDKPQNPLTVVLPTGSLIPAAYRQEFTERTRQLLTLLNLHQNAVALKATVNATS